MAHKKGVGSSKNGRESHAKRLGTKRYGEEMAEWTNQDQDGSFTYPW